MSVALASEDGYHVKSVWEDADPDYPVWEIENTTTGLIRIIITMRRKIVNLIG